MAIQEYKLIWFCLGIAFVFSRLLGLLIEPLFMACGHVYLHQSAFGVCDDLVLRLGGTTAMYLLARPFGVLKAQEDVGPLLEDI